MRKISTSSDTNFTFYLDKDFHLFILKQITKSENKIFLAKNNHFKFLRNFTERRWTS